MCRGCRLTGATVVVVAKARQLRREADRCACRSDNVLEVRLRDTFVGRAERHEDSMMGSRVFE